MLQGVMLNWHILFFISVYFTSSEVTETQIIVKLFPELSHEHHLYTKIWDVHGKHDKSLFIFPCNMFWQPPTILLNQEQIWEETEKLIIRGKKISLW